MPSDPVGAIDGEVVGFCSLVPSERTWELDNLRVAPQFVHRGVGRALLAHALEVAFRGGASSVTVGADPNAESFYLSRGAVRCGEVPAPIQGQPDRVRPQLAFVTATLRQALRSDVREIMRVRHAVKENRLASRVISDDEVIQAIEKSGRGWVIEDRNTILAFAIGNAESGNIWALFVDPAHEARGFGRRLHDEMTSWLWSRGLRRLWLSTEPGTRAQRFYERAGWQNCGLLPSGEILLELNAPKPSSSDGSAASAERAKEQRGHPR
jgi:GNAT superfamily N-acetyltransferase